MFKKSRRKIVAAILSVLVLLLAGTFCIIYLASYVSMTRENQDLLSQYVKAYMLPEDQSPAGKDDRNTEFSDGERPGTGRGGLPGDPPLLELSTFYSVAVSKSGEVLKVDTADIESFDEASLRELAAGILESGESSGVRMNLSFRTADKERLSCWLKCFLSMSSSSSSQKSSQLSRSFLHRFFISIPSNKL